MATNFCRLTRAGKTGAGRGGGSVGLRWEVGQCLFFVLLGHTHPPSVCHRSNPLATDSQLLLVFLPQLLHVLNSGLPCLLLAAILVVREGFSLIWSIWNVFKQERRA